NGTNPNGTWSLYVFDDAGGDMGSFAGGWEIDIITDQCPTPTPPPTPTPAPTPAGCVVLYDQTDNSAGNFITSQDFESDYDIYDDQAADDFVVPSGEIWTVQSVNAGGGYFNGSGPMPLVNLYFYSDAGGLPGALVASYLNTPLQADSAGSISANIPGG